MEIFMYKFFQGKLQQAIPDKFYFKKFSYLILGFPFKFESESGLFHEMLG